MSHISYVMYPGHLNGGGYAGSLQARPPLLVPKSDSRTQLFHLAKTVELRCNVEAEVIGNKAAKSPEHGQPWYDVHWSWKRAHAEFETLNRET
jgi:hypothetical protein